MENLLLPGQPVRLKGTDALFRIRLVYQRDRTNPSEVWCQLVSRKGQTSYWRMAQLEPVGKLLTENDPLQ